MSRLKRTLNRAKKVLGTTERPRLAVHKSIRHITAQIIDDSKAVTLAYAVSGKEDKNNIETAKKVGADIAQKAAAKGIKKVNFDRRRYLYHGKVKALADAARGAGLEF
ncbi:50S ribosomal protein L18 [Candidatus Termititenax spirochaetophilus]|uniref:Large ribosomal subunit protein uL18 n=1 Tax=Candidatus Termititenax spirochaetophilus TaxID=2218522 RepID=A0A388T6M6_9BACT|nr:50S ribosomal protein L18 [Candidatus Termititenax spirochaetophilus]